MSTFACTIEKLTILPHPNADQLELAEVGLYRAVVPKGVYETGDYALYIPEQAILPPYLIKELGLVGKLAGKDSNRVKAVKLRGELSQGIVCRPTPASGYKFLWTENACKDDPTDYALDFGITKWVPDVPVHMQGDVEACPDLVRWIDIENVGRYPEMFNVNEPVIATEKIHGTACLITYVRNGEEDHVHVSSKGYGAKSLAIKPNADNLYWRAVLHNLLPMKLKEMALKEGAKRIGLFGEIFGKGVQDLAYGYDAGQDKTLGFRAFDCWMEYDTPDEPAWVDAEDFVLLMTRHRLPFVPYLYVGPFSFQTLAKAVSGDTWISGPLTLANKPQIREGIVIRSATESRSVYGGRKIAKWVSSDYLTRKNGTEYE